jgi:hypothetical protein
MDTDFLTTPCGGPMRLTGSVTLHTLRWAKIIKIEIRHELTRSIFRRELHELTRIDSNKDAKAAVLAHYHHGRGGTRPYHEDQRFSVIAKSQTVPDGHRFFNHG